MQIAKRDIKQRKITIMQTKYIEASDDHGKPMDFSYLCHLVWVF